jgi:hypothetical protein
VEDSWALGLNESPTLGVIALTRLRTFSGPALVERCYKAWHNQHVIHLEFRNPDGLEQHAPIMAARYVETEEGHLLLLWVRLIREDTELELGFDDDDEQDDDGEDFPSDLPPDTGFPLGPSDWSL